MCGNTIWSSNYYYYTSARSILNLLIIKCINIATGVSLSAHVNSLYKLFPKNTFIFFLYPKWLTSRINGFFYKSIKYLLIHKLFTTELKINFFSIDISFYDSISMAIILYFVNICNSLSISVSHIIIEHLFLPHQLPFCL